MSDIVIAETETDRLRRENAALRDALRLANDRLAMARRRIRVLRGNDVLSSASTRGLVIWLRAIDRHAGAIDYVHTHLRAMIELLSGEDQEP